MLHRAFPIAARLTPALTPALYLQLRWMLPNTQSGQDMAAMLTGWFIVVCAVAIVASRHLLDRAER